MIIYESGYSDEFDGPGTRLIYYLKGCNFRCGWCGAPESISAEPEILRYPERTVTAGQVVTSEEIAAKARSARDFIDGVTFGGGEPTLQGRELLHALHLLRQIGIHTAIESNASTAVYKEIATAADLVFSDLKTVNPALFCKWIAPSAALLETVMENLRFAAAYQPELRIRIPVVTGVNDSLEEQERLSGFCAELLTLRPHGRLEVQLLRQHHLAESKYKALGRFSAFAETGAPSRENLEHFTEELRRKKIDASFFG